MLGKLDDSRLNRMGITTLGDVISIVEHARIVCLSSKKRLSSIIVVVLIFS